MDASPAEFIAEPRHPLQDEFLRHCRWLRTVLLARSGDPSAVDDLLQEVSLAVSQQCRTDGRVEDARPWFYRVAVRQALLHRRKLGRRRRLQQRVAEQVEQGGGSPERHDPLGWLLAEERQALVREALATLARKDAELLLLKYTEDWNYQQLAEHLGLTPAAIDGRLHRARHRLRQKLMALQVTEVHP